MRIVRCIAISIAAVIVTALPALAGMAISQRLGIWQEVWQLLW